MTDEERKQLGRIVSGELTPALPACWTLDCQGKQDLDCSIVHLSTRYYPDFTSYPSIYIGDLQVVRGEFEGKTEGEAKFKAECWAQEMFIRILRAVAREMLDLES